MKLNAPVLSLAFFFCMNGLAQPVRLAGVMPHPDDSIRLSLITCAAGKEIYTLFGHSAIRYENLTRKTDVVYNYGVFDFDTPHFAFRFALGETDYQLARDDFQRFASSYAYEGRDVWQQALNLTQTEKLALVQQLEANYLPQNRVYRYNFLYDNCSTRPRDQIERAVGNSVRYAGKMDELQPDVTLRSLLHLYSEGHPWARFALDLCMGSRADEPVSRRTRQFVPFYLQETFRTASIAGSTSRERPLVAEEKTLVNTGLTAADHREGGVTPLQCALCLWALVTLLTAYGLYKGKTLWWLDLLLFAAAGSAGCVPAFMVLFSQHPAVSPNYLLFILHPFHLLCLPWAIRKARKRKLSVYLTANMAVLTLFMIFWAALPQRLPLPMLFVALCLWERSVNNALFWRKNRQSPITSNRKGKK